MTPLEAYQQDLAEHGFNRDPAQEMAIGHLQTLFEQLAATPSDQRPGKFRKLLGRKTQPTSIKGLYFWGGVGRGKTYLMDKFYHALPFENKMRSHFHRFMHDVHGRLKALEGKKDPLKTIAQDIRQQARVLCFDEFFVSDIGDAMILGTLMQYLFDQGITLVTTSNIEPKGLYKDGLQRQRFLPTIELLYQHTEIINVDGGIDHRLRTLEQAEIYHYPLDAAADKNLQAYFQSLAVGENCIEQDTEVKVLDRPIQARYVADDIAWFDFGALCDGPRSQADYIELGRLFHAVIISNIPQLGGIKDDQARRFINLVDEFYDRNVKLIISANKPLENLYSEGNLTFEFQRTQSRLLEMQSKDYLASEHKP